MSEMLTVREAAKRLGVTVAGVHDRINAGKLRTKKVPGIGRGGYHYLIDATQFRPAANGKQPMVESIDALIERVARIEHTLFGGGEA